MYQGLNNVHKSYNEVEKVIFWSPVLNMESIINYNDLGIYKLICLDCSESNLKIFFDKTIKPLYEYDRKKSAELVKTLEEYYKCAGNIKQVSKSMYTHYNTIRHRINRIEEITGKSLEHFEDSLEFKLGLKVKGFFINKEND